MKHCVSVFFVSGLQRAESAIIFSMKRMLMIYNPQSGTGKAIPVLSKLIDHFTKEKYEVTVHPTQEPLDGQKYITERGHDFNVIAVIGGDGILHEAVNGLAGIDFDVQLMYLPAGTTNDFANTHNIDMDLAAAARQLSNGRDALLDLGVFNGEYFAYVAACGLATAVSYETSQDEKRRFGPLAYIVKALSSVDFQHWENNCIPMSAKWQNGEAEGDFLFVSISNSRYIGGSDKLVDDGFSWNDGLLEGLFIRRPMNLMDLNAILSGILRKEFSEEYFIQVQSPWFEIHSAPASWTLDGEYGGIWEDIRVETIPMVLAIRLPSRTEEV